MHLLKLTSLFLFVLGPSMVCLAERSFTIDYTSNQFIKDGQPFRFISGSMHYFRVPRQYWRDRMMKMRLAGIQALETITEWSLHEPRRSEYNFTGQLDIVDYIKTAQECGLLVIFRPGPYTCGERTMGGMPYWLLKVNPKMRMRSSDSSFLGEADRWLSVVLPMIKPLLYANGGPIIAVQVENEYGFVQWECDFAYTSHLRDLFRHYLGNQIILTTNDAVSDDLMKCGKIDQVLETIDSQLTDPEGDIRILRRHQQSGPVMVAEFYPGWYDAWEQPHHVSDTNEYCRRLDKVLAMEVNASVNVYLFHGGTSFGFTSAAKQQPDQSVAFTPTSYDFEAPLDEAGDPNQLYFAVRDVIKKYFPVPTTDEISLPKPAPKMQLDPIAMVPVASLFDGRIFPFDKPVVSKYPMTFEQLDLAEGFVLYSTNITVEPSDPAVVSAPGLADRAQVFVDGVYQGTMSRSKNLFQLPVEAKKGSRLDIYVENQGRFDFGPFINEFKGLTKNVTIESNHILTDWQQTTVFKDWDRAIERLESIVKTDPQPAPVANRVPTFFRGEFVVPNTTGYPLDTFLRLDGWSKGVAFLNGFNLGRYWPKAGPQVTLYAPGPLFRAYPEHNVLWLFELEQSPCRENAIGSCQARFVKQHVLNGTVPTTGV